MTLRVHADGFFAAQDQLDWPPGDEREECRLGLDGHVLLSAKRTAACGQLHVEALLRQAQEGRDLTPVVEDALALGIEGQSSVRQGLRESRFGLEEEMLDPLSVPGAADDMGARSEGRSSVSSADHRS